ncbi:MAG TPA: transporter substrate-binding domain-containing protein [Burkholderiaceae bacterium]|jgi:polar amino acid transport system substrate-binding protein|nr:transporter substrate-binding domain-containing protein [Burkholderiaceae bacterium]
MVSFMLTHCLRRFAACLLAVVLWPGAHGQTLTVSTNNTPLDRKALQQISEEAFHRVGLEFKLVNLPSERSLLAANLGEVDGEGLRVDGLSDQYLHLVKVPERYIKVSFVAFTRDATISLDRGWDSLKPYRVAFIHGWKMFEANAAGARVVHRVDKPEQMFRMLEEGRIDVVLYTRADGIALARSLGFAAIAPLTPALREVDMFLYLHDRHRGLAPRVAQAVRDMKSDGSYNRILSAIAVE